MGPYTVLKKHLLPAEPPLLCPIHFSKDTTPDVCAFLIHILTRDAASPLGQRETWESVGLVRPQGCRGTRFYNRVIQDMTKVAHSHLAVCAQRHLPAGSQGVKDFLWN